MIFKNKRVQIVFSVLGALGGLIYWKFVGCESGTCAIKSVWYWSTLWGTAVGYLLGDLISELIRKWKKRQKENDEQ